MSTPSIAAMFARRQLLRSEAGDRKVKLGVKDVKGVSVVIDVPRSQDMGRAALVALAARTAAKASSKEEGDDGIVRNVPTTHKGKDAGRIVSDLFDLGLVATGKLSAESFEKGTDDELRLLGVNPHPTDAAGGEPAAPADGATADGATAPADGATVAS